MRRKRIEGPRRAVTRAETAAAIICVVVITCLLSMVFARPGNLQAQAAGNIALHKLTLKDQQQLREIHQTFILYAEGNKGIYPIPGLIDRLPDPTLGEMVGVGPEDPSQNTTARLHAAMIAQRFYTPQLVISPVERNPQVAPKQEYDFDAYRPTADTFWDDSFTGDLLTGSNASYAHLPIHGQRATTEWRSTFNAHTSVLGNRGPRAGELDPLSFTCGMHGQWAGNVAYQDNHVEFHSSTTIQPNPQVRADNLFLPDQGLTDVFNTFTRSMKPTGPEVQHD